MGRLAKPEHPGLNQRDVKTTLLNCLAASILSRVRVVRASRCSSFLEAAG